MKPLFLIWLSFFTVTGLAQRPDSSGSTDLFEKMMAEINTKHVNWVKTTAREAHSKNWGETEIRKATVSYANLGGMSGMDIEALAFLVLMQSAKSAREDLKAIMAQVKAINKQKEELRNAMEKIKVRKTMTRIQLDSIKLINDKIAAFKNGKDPNSVKLIKSANPTAIASAQEINTVVQKMQDNKDSLSGQSEMQQLKLQRVMERMTKADTAASNALKKFIEVANASIQNLK